MSSGGPEAPVPRPAEADAGPRAALLRAATEHVASSGIDDLSLRALGRAIGTSHRMLIHHFGSKEGLWIAIAEAVEDRERGILEETVTDLGDPGREELLSWWKHISDPSLWPHERLFFELYGQALRKRKHTEGFLEAAIDRWVEPVVAQAVAGGTPETLARARARLGLAVTRGLLLDLLATGDVEAADSAMRAFIELLDGES